MNCDFLHELVNEENNKVFLRLPQQMYDALLIFASQSVQVQEVNNVEHYALDKQTVSKRKNQSLSARGIL